MWPRPLNTSRVRSHTIPQDINIFLALLHFLCYDELLEWCIWVRQYSWHIHLSVWANPWIIRQSCVRFEASALYSRYWILFFLYSGVSLLVCYTRNTLLCIVAYTIQFDCLYWTSVHTCSRVYKRVFMWWAGVLYVCMTAFIMCTGATCILCSRHRPTYTQTV